MRTKLLLVTLLLFPSAFAAARSQYCGSALFNGHEADFVISEDKNKIFILDSTSSSFKKCLSEQQIVSTLNTSCGKKITVAGGTMYETCGTNFFINRDGVDQGSKFILSGVCLAPQEEDSAPPCRY
jgi:hypothetical protein